MYLIGCKVTSIHMSVVSANVDDFYNISHIV